MANKVLIDRAVVQQALEALQTELMGYDGPVPHIDSAITALRAALAQAEPVQGPFALPCPTPKACKAHCCSGYCVPPQRPAEPVQAEPTRSQRLADAGFTRRHSLWALQARQALELIAAPQRPDGTWNRDREACRQIAAEALGRYEDE